MAKEKTQESKEFDALYHYVKKEILNYDSNQSLPKNYILRLRGLANGKYMANKKVKSQANYSFEVILNTFIYCNRAIKRAIQTKDFASEQLKFNYIIAIVQNNLNDVYNKMKEAEKQKEKVHAQKIELMESNYKRRTEDVKNERLKDLW